MGSIRRGTLKKVEAKKERVPNGKCGVCRHAESTRIELLIARGANIRAVSRQFGISYSITRRHWIYHVTESRRASLVMGPAQRMALASQVAEESASVLDHYAAIRSGLYQFFNAALETGDRVTGAHIAGKLKDVNDSIARLTGQLAQSPLVTNNTLVVMQSPEVQGFLQELARELKPYPDALHAMVTWLEAREARTLAEVNRAPALEHQT